MRNRYFIFTLILLVFLIDFYLLGHRLASQLYYRKATCSMRDGQFEKAAVYLEKAVEQNTDDSLIWKSLGKAYRNIGNTKPARKGFYFAQKAEYALNTAAVLNPLDSETFYELAVETEKLQLLNLYLNSGRNSGNYNALPFFQKAVHLKPNSILYQYSFIRYLHRQGKNSELLRVVGNLSRIYPAVYGSLKNEPFWSPAVEKAVKQGMYRAVAEGIHPRKTTMTLSSLLAEEKDYQEAVSLYRKGMSFHPKKNNSGNFYHLGRLYLQNRQFKEAEDSFLKALSLSGTKDKDLKNLYRFYMSMGYAEELYGFLQRAGNNFNLSDTIDILVARTLIKLHRFKQARRILMDLNQQESSAEAYYYLARIAEIEKDWDRMEIAIQKATVLDRFNSRYYQIFSQVLKRLNKLERAEKAMDMAIKYSNGPSSGLFNHRAWIRWDRKDFIGAAKDWEAALQVQPDNAAFHALAGEAYLQSGKWSHALDHYKKATTLDPKNATYRKKYNKLLAAHRN